MEIKVIITKIKNYGECNSCEDEALYKMNIATFPEISNHGGSTVYLCANCTRRLLHDIADRL